MLEEQDVKSLLKSIKKTDSKLSYIEAKIERKGIDHLSISELNYIRELNKLPKLSITKLRDLLYENYISYSDVKRETNISRSMLCMILRENRNCTIAKLKLIMNMINNRNNNITLKDILEG